METPISNNPMKTQKKIQGQSLANANSLYRTMQGNLHMTMAHVPHMLFVSEVAPGPH